MKKILVTGGLGYIGSHTVMQLIESGYEPIILDNLENSFIETISKIEQITGKKPLFYNADIRNNSIEQVFLEHEIYAVIHFAAFKSVNESILFPEKYYENNVVGTINVLNMMKKYDVKNIIFSSSCTVYGKPYFYPISEHTCLNKAESVYGKTKQICESKIQEYQTDINSVILRYFNPIGAH
jgi:UDP-glucose 4-epimerase